MGLTLLGGRFRILTVFKSYREKMAEKNKRSQPRSSKPLQPLNPEERNVAGKKTPFGMKEKLLAEGIGEPLPEDLVRPFDIGDGGNRADAERTQEVSILISARDKEKLLAIEGALEKIREGTYGVCEECGEEIGAGRLKAMPLAKLCVTCQFRTEKGIAHQRFAERDCVTSPDQ